MSDSNSVRAVYEREATGTSLVDCANPGSNYLATGEAHGIPLASCLTRASVPDVKESAPLCDWVSAVGSKLGQKSESLMADQGNDSEFQSEGLRQMGGAALLAEKDTEDGRALGVYQ